LAITSANKRAVIVFATWSYREILSNWVSVAPPRITQDLVVHAYGLLYPILLRRLGHRVVTVSRRRPTRSGLWRDRVMAILSYLELSVEVVVCDADAVVLTDFTDELSAVEGDLLVSQGVGHPKEVFNAWHGFTLCCGFAVYRPTDRTISLMRKVSAHSMGERYDDQTALNTVLLENNLVWDSSRTQYFIEDGKRKIRCFSENLIGTVSEGELLGLRVILLPHASYRRMPNSNESSNPKVFHPLPKVGKGKGVKQSLQENGLWWL